MSLHEFQQFAIVSLKSVIKVKIEKFAENYYVIHKDTKEKEGK